MAGLLAKKCDMTRVIKDQKIVPVTLLEVPALTVAQVKTLDKDGYEAVVLSFQDGKQTTLKEVPMSAKLQDVKIGDAVTLDLLDGVETVTIVSISKGKGFAGAMKRWNFSGGPGRVGSKFHRALGSIGTRKPRRTKPGQKMHGHMGLDQVTLHDIPVVLVNKELNIVAVKGPVPGARNSLVTIKF